LAYADTDTIKKNTGAFLDASKQVGIEMNQRAKYVKPNSLVTS
jgi:hypothetical protein